MKLFFGTRSLKMKIIIGVILIFTAVACNGGGGGSSKSSVDSCGGKKVCLKSGSN